MIETLRSERKSKFHESYRSKHSICQRNAAMLRLLPRHMLPELDTILICVLYYHDHAIEEQRSCYGRSRSKEARINTVAGAAKRKNSHCHPVASPKNNKIGTTR